MKKFFGIAFFLAFTVIASFGQAGFGTLAGVVTDQTQAIVPNALVELTGASGEHHTTKTNNAGEYQFTALPVGSGYSITVTSKGFTPIKVNNLSASVGTTITQNVALKAGGSDVVVEVTATAVEQVQTDTSSVSQLIDRTIWQDSPLETRTQNAFVGLVAGASADAAGTGRGFAVDGSRTGTGNFLVEGMDNNDQGQGGAGTPVGMGGAVTTISPDAIEEYRVITHNPSAEYGRAGGFSTDTSLKSGTSKFHGSLFEYNRIQALDANDFFSNRAGVKDSRIRNQFGGSVGGPIYKDRTFFFTTLELQRFREGTPLTGTVTTQAFLNFVDSGAFEAFQESDPAGLCMVYNGAACPGAFNRAAHLGPVFKQLLTSEPNAFPLGTQQPTTAAAGLYTGGAVTYPVPVYAQVTKIQKIAVNQERASFKLDHKLTDKDQLSFSYLLDFGTTGSPLAAGGATFGPDETNVAGSQLFTGSWTHTFTPSLQNVFRAGYTRHLSNFAATNVAGVPETVTDDPLEEGFGASSGIPQLFTENEFVYEDSVTKVIGRDTLKAGFRFVRTRNGSSFYNDVNGTILPWDVESLVTDETFDDQADSALAQPYGQAYGSLAVASAAVDSTTNSAPDVYRAFRANEFAAYVQNDWKATNRLTLNLGLRWEYFGPPHNAEPGFDSNVYFGAFAAPTPNGNPFLPNAPFFGAIQNATFIQKNSNIWNKDTNNFAPRLGFSYDPTGKGKLAIRGGFGIGYDRLYNNVYENIRFNSPRFSDNSIGIGASNVVAGALEQPSLLNIPFTANSLFVQYGGKPVPRHIDQRLVTAYYEQANLGFEYELAKGYVFETNYAGTFGRKLVGLKDANNFDGRTACPTLTATCQAAGFTVATTARPNLLFNGDNFRTNGFNSNYNSLQLSLRKSYSNGLQVLANYTYSKSLDEISDVFSVKNGASGITDPENPGYDYGPADFDVKHNTVITLNYALPWRKKNLVLGGWALTTIASLSSGTPFSIVDTSGSYDPNKDGRTDIDREPYIGGGSYKNAINHAISPADGFIKQNVFAGQGVNAAGNPNPRFACPANINLGLWCNAPMSRNAFYGPGSKNDDFGIIKRFYINDGQKVTFQANFFNIFNHPNFGEPVSDVNNGLFGTSQSDAEPRITQLSLRYDF
jgi:hypothetical protein